MRVLLWALAGATLTAAIFRREDIARFKKQNEEKIKQAILAMESTREEANGTRIELSSNPDDVIQEGAVAKQTDDKYDALERSLDLQLQEAMRGGLLGKKATGPFDYLMFTMIYPVATCMSDNDQVPGSCEIAEGVDPWTIHGLWPNYNDGSYPQFCDQEKFDVKQVEALKEKLKSHWPNLFPNKPETQLWEHEWSKHGTCGETDPLLSTQFKYFNVSLAMLDQIDLRTKLEQKGVSPRSAPYDRDTLHQSVNEAVGHKVQLYCLNDKKTQESLLADVRVCLDRELQLIDCPEHEVHPFVLAGSVTPNDHQPLPVPSKCAETMYYVEASGAVGARMDILPPVGDEHSEETGKKMSKEEHEDDDYYADDDEKKIGSKSQRDQEEEARAAMLEKELMDGLNAKTERYLQNRREQLKNGGEDYGLTEALSMQEESRRRGFAEVAEMARLFQQSRVREALGNVASNGDRWPHRQPASIYLSIILLVLYIVVIVAFFAGRRSDRQRYGRLEDA